MAYGDPGWYVYDVVGSALKPDYADNPADFQKRYGAPPMPDKWYSSEAAAAADIAGNFQSEPKALQSTGGAPNPFGSVSSVADAVAKVGGLLSGFASVVTDASLYRSVGWLLLGVALIIFGIIFYFRKAAVEVAGTALGAAAKAA